MPEGGVVTLLAVPRFASMFVMTLAMDGKPNLAVEQVSQKIT